MSQQIAYCLSEDDARRISGACLNACNGLPDEALDGGWTAKGIDGYAKSFERQIKRGAQPAASWGVQRVTVRGSACPQVETYFEVGGE